MKKYFLFLIPITLFVLIACNYRPANMEDKTNTTNLNRVNREKTISFLGIKLGTPNNRYQSILDSTENVLTTDLPDVIRYRCLGSGNCSIFYNPYEEYVGTFFATLIDGNNKKYSGWGIAVTDGDSITKVHYIIPEPLNIDSIYDGLKLLYEKQYGDPDEEYIKEGKAMDNIGCYWDFVHNQRIYLNKCDANDGWVFDYQRVEIVYQDMNSIQRQINQAEKQREKERQDSINAVEKEKQNNAKQKEGQQI